MKYEQHNINQINLRDWTVDFSSDVYNLPAGPLGVAIGYEHLDNYGYNHPDALQTEFTKGLGPTNGRLVTDAEYAEINVPLLSDLPFVKELSVDIANLWSQFKRSGGNIGNNTQTFVHDSSGRLNIRYQVNDDLLLRATVYHDINVGYTVPQINTTFTLGVQNLFDKKPPTSRANTTNNYYSTAHRLPSRLICGDICVRFWSRPVRVVFLT